MNEDKEYPLLDYNFANGKKKLKVILTYFKDIPKIDIREYYFDENDAAFKHSKKGIQLDPKKAEALRTALENNAKIIDKHLISEDLEKWASKIKIIESSADFFSEYEFYKTRSTGQKDEIIFNENHPFGKKIFRMEAEIKNNKNAEELLQMLKTVLITYSQSLNQFDEESKITVGNFLQDQNQTWASLLKRISNSIK
jgi:hypothetical protein